MRKTSGPTLNADLKRLTGADLDASRAFLLGDCFVPGKGFSAQYAGQATVSCTTTAICAYALAETGPLTERKRSAFRQALLAFRFSGSGEHRGAFPRTTGGAPSAWTTAQATLALLRLGTPWEETRPSVEWLLRAQAANGGWNYSGSAEGHEHPIFSFYAILVLLICRRRLRAPVEQAVSRARAFLRGSEKSYEAGWLPLLLHLGRLTGLMRRGAQWRATRRSEYEQLFEDGWPTVRVDEDWLPDRFNMALLCGANYLHLRHAIVPTDSLALLHVRYLADERIGFGWSDRRESDPKTWATALGVLTLHRWASDVTRAPRTLKRLPTRWELFAQIQERAAPAPRVSKRARELVRRFGETRSGLQHAAAYEALIVDTFVFLFGDTLKEPESQSKTSRGTLRRDITFRNAAEKGPWFDWKLRHMIESVLIECKNKEVLSHGDLRQTAGYLGKSMGRLAILACRKTTVDDVRELLNWFVTSDDKYILVLNDEALTDWIRLKGSGGDPTAALADLYRSLREGVQ